MAARKKTTTAKRSTKPADTEYYTEEIVDNCEGIFGSEISRECVEAALKMEQLEKTSIKNAKKITEKFLHKEVR